MTYLIKRGRRAQLRYAVAHVGTYDYLGRLTGQAACGRVGFDLSSNVPWGLRVCKQCRSRMKGRD